MKKLLLAAVATLALTSTAQAGRIGCSITYDNGQTMTWIFEVFDGYWREVAVNRNEAGLVIHPAGTRPVWNAHGARNNRLVVVTYRPDPRYQMVVEPTGKNSYYAAIGRSDIGAKLGTGACYFKESFAPDEGGAYQ